MSQTINHKSMLFVMERSSVDLCTSQNDIQESIEIWIASMWLISLILMNTHRNTSSQIARANIVTVDVT